ncbi:MAG: UvrD-helicase domain-containing protein, partial [Acetobacteraceae bacterium]
MRGARDEAASDRAAAGKRAALGLAEQAQRIASDPGVSAFVAASAGSGKTKLLTDRLLRLMLAGCEPAKILCLTFTRAAAAEMALRLQRRLGAWIGMADADLDGALAELGVAPGEEQRRRARQLFAEVLDLPGGMRISTIHAFCQSVLRRFPLEAELSPHFELEPVEEAALALSDAERRVLAGRGLAPVIAVLAPQLGALDRLGEFLGELVAMMDRFAWLAALAPAARGAAFRRAAGAPLVSPERAFVAADAALGMA